MKKYYDFELNKIIDENRLKDDIRVSLCDIEEFINDVLGIKKKINFDSIINSYIQNGAIFEITDDDIVEVSEDDGELWYCDECYGPGTYVDGGGHLYPVY